MISPLITAAPEGTFVIDPRLPEGAPDPVFGHVHQGWLHGMWAVQNPVLGVAQLTDGARVVTPTVDGSVWDAPGFFRRRASNRHVDVGGHRYTLHHTSLRKAQLKRDGVAICWLQRVRTGRFWHGGWIRTYEVEHWSNRADRTGAAVAHLLASRYSVGAPGAFLNALAVLTLPFRLFS